MELNIYDLLNSKNFKHKHLNLKDELESLKKDLLIKKENFIDNPFLKKYMALNTFNVNEPVRFMKDSFTGNIGISNIRDEKSELYMVSDNVPVDVKIININENMIGVIYKDIDNDYTKIKIFYINNTSLIFKEERIIEYDSIDIVHTCNDNKGSFIFYVSEIKNNILKVKYVFNDTVSDEIKITNDYDILVNNKTYENDDNGDNVSKALSNDSHNYISTVIDNKIIMAINRSPEIEIMTVYIDELSIKFSSLTVITDTYNPDLIKITPHIDSSKVFNLYYYDDDVSGYVIFKITFDNSLNYHKSYATELNNKYFYSECVGKINTDDTILSMLDKNNWKIKHLVYLRKDDTFIDFSEMIPSFDINRISYPDKDNAGASIIMEQPNLKVVDIDSERFCLVAYKDDKYIYHIFLKDTINTYCLHSKFIEESLESSFFDIIRIKENIIINVLNSIYMDNHIMSKIFYLKNNPYRIIGLSKTVGIPNTDSYVNIYNSIISKEQLNYPNDFELRKFYSIDSEGKIGNPVDLADIPNYNLYFKTITKNKVVLKRKF